MFGLPAHRDFFVYVVAMLALFLAGFFIVSARNEVRDFFRLSVVTRFSVPFFLGAFAVLGLAKINIMLFAVPDVLLALWTLLALRADARSTSTTAAVVSGAGISNVR